MPRATVSSKGQVTIPREVRRALGLHAGDGVQFTEVRDGVFELRPANRPLSALRGALAHRAPAKAISVEEMNAAIVDASAGANR